MEIQLDEVFGTLGGKFSYSDVMNRFGGQKKDWKNYLLANGFVYRQTTLDGKKGRYWCYERDSKKIQLDIEFKNLKYWISELPVDKEKIEHLNTMIGRIQRQVSSIQIEAVETRELPDVDKSAKEVMEARVQDANNLDDRASVYNYYYGFYYWLLSDGKFGDSYQEALVRHFKYSIVDCLDNPNPSREEISEFSFYLNNDEQLINYFTDNWHNIDEDLSNITSDVLSKVEQIFERMNYLEPLLKGW